ncbi:Hypothetical protein DIP0018 [Corynebacterium diphtheriae]|uniref:Uncharacterized protein n=1 Tax=Corynebacterium diphtheriae (strain ATCC 700971 / NCTC 13129 / Biotype gravis) TaxID=257309 RepID=Q6NKK0_CORDI|nr:hypothetical protein B179_10994 [Corynebacterium diphtheriae str. Aberdeen]OSQ04705.1 hypothetical protein B1A61_08840 [Corynebacterium diphtheriae]CAE48529.1 Hypothetical protein DIP0018 [Corynebacterium diphtheriae]
MEFGAYGVVATEALWVARQCEQDARCSDCFVAANNRSNAGNVVIAYECLWDKGVRPFNVALDALV